ncbi:uncharacterized protein VNE69_09005 [Vairimorpha necatrix]|uniref:Uncharacterized protein n=1 Tax=Vairimorpha necatrix TaxID=6039 RepID=A0AAX4JEN6_9MICR
MIEDINRHLSYLNYLKEIKSFDESINRVFVKERASEQVSMHIDRRFLLYSAIATLWTIEVLLDQNHQLILHYIERPGIDACGLSGNFLH